MGSCYPDYLCKASVFRQRFCFVVKVLAIVSQAVGLRKERHKEKMMKTDIQKQYFLMHLPLGVEGYALDQSSAQKHIQEIGPLIFPPGFKQQLGLFATPINRRARQAQLRQQHVRSAAEWIVFFCEDGGAVGWFYGYMEDEESFFMDTIVIPEYRGAGIYTAFLTHLKAYLKAKGYERISTSHLPNNRGALIADLKAGFTIVGIEMDESHGIQVKMTNSLYDDRRRAFERVFSIEPE